MCRFYISSCVLNFRKSLLCDLWFDIVTLRALSGSVLSGQNLYAILPAILRVIENLPWQSGLAQAIF